MSTPRYDVMVVPARRAYPLYLAEAVYWIPEERFVRARELKWIGFYTDGAIQPHIARIIRWKRGTKVAALPRNKPMLAQELSHAIRASIVNADEKIQVITLSPPADRATTVLPRTIPTERHDRRGYRIAWAMRARYVQYSVIAEAPPTTEALDELNGQPVSWLQWTAAQGQHKRGSA